MLRLPIARGLLLGSSLMLARASFAQAPELATEVSNSSDQTGGILVTDGTVLRPRAFLATVYQTNSFYQDNSDAGGIVGSSSLRFGAGLSFATLPPKRMEQSHNARLTFDSDVELTWNQFLTDNDTLNEHNDLGILAGLNLTLFPEGQITFGLRDRYARMVRPPPAISTQSADRDKNELEVYTTARPGGGAISITGAYQFDADLFERSEVTFANRLTHTFKLKIGWQWLPQTRVFLDSKYSIIDPNDETYKSSAQTIESQAGISTLFLPTVGAILRAGYAQSFYDVGPNFQSYTAVAELRWAVTDRLRTGLGYQRDFHDSLIGNYYDDNSVFARLSAMLTHKLELSGAAEVRFRDYSGVPGMPVSDVMFCGNTTCSSSDRKDVIFAGSAGLRFNATNWLMVSAGYNVHSVNTDFYVQTGTGTNSAGFVAHEVSGSVTASY